MMFCWFVFLVQTSSVVSNTLDITETGKKVIKVDSTGITAKVCGGSGKEDLYFCYGKKTKDGKHESNCPENHCGFKVYNSKTSWTVISASKTAEMQTTCFDVLVKPEGVQTTGGSVLNAECTWDAGTDDKLEISVDLPPGYTLQLVGAQIWTDAPPPVKTTETWVWAVAGVGVVIGLAMIIGGIVAFIKCRNKKAQQQQEILTEVKVDPSSARSKDLKKKKKKEEAPNPEGSKEIPSQVSSYKKPDEMPSGIQKMMTKVQKRIKFDVKKQKTLKVTLDEDEDGQTPAKNENGAEESKEPMKNEEKTAEKKEMEAPPPKNDVAQTKEKEKEIKQKGEEKSMEKLGKKEEGNSVKVEIIGQESAPEKENMPKAAEHVENISAEPIFKQESKVETAPELPNFERKLELGKFKAGDDGILGTGGAGCRVSRPSTSGKTRTTSSGAPRRDSRKKKKHKKLNIQPVNLENLWDESDPRCSDIMKPGKEEKARQIQRKMIQEQRMRSERAQKLKTEKEKENLRTNETQEAEDDGAADDGRPQRTADTQKSSDDEKGAESNQN